jgi:hypothetical protein
MFFIKRRIKENKPMKKKERRINRYGNMAKHTRYIY